MNDTYRSKHATIWEQDWVKLGYLPERDQIMTRKALPIFQRGNGSRPAGYQYIWPQYQSSEAYEAMYAYLGPILELASYILESPRSLEFLDEVTHSTRRILPPHVLTNQGHRCKEFGWTEGPSKETRQRARKTLHNLSSSLTFQIADPELFPEIQGSLAITKHTLVGFMNGVNIGNDPIGMGSASRIIINKTYIRRLNELIAQEKAEGRTMPEKMSLQFKLAATLGHEVNHALANAVDKELLEIQKIELNNLRLEQRRPRALGTNEPFYKKERMAEIGNSWEHQVFGGKVMWSGESASDPLFVCKWPSFLTLSGEDDYPTRGNENFTARKYVVPFHYIQNLHRQEFWESMGSEDAGALVIKRTIGIEYQNPDTGALSTDSSQEETPLEEGLSRVDREKSGKPIDGSNSRANETVRERHIRESRQ